MFFILDPYMALFDFLKPKRKEELPLPPPPAASSAAPNELPEIRTDTAAPYQPPEQPLLPEIPVMPEEPEISPAPVIEAPIETHEEEQPTEEPPSETPGHVFVTIGDYKTIVDKTNAIQARLTEAQNVLKTIEEIKTQEDKELARWKTTLDQLDKRLSYVDKLISQAKA